MAMKPFLVKNNVNYANSFVHNNIGWLIKERGLEGLLLHWKRIRFFGSQQNVKVKTFSTLRNYKRMKTV